MTATLRNFTDTPVTVDGQTLTAAAQPLGCTDALPDPQAGCYILVPACLAAASLTRSDVIWSAAVPHCSRCAPPHIERGWFATLRNLKASVPTLHTVVHHTPDEGRQSVGMEFFRQRYLE